jgi:hypothetical protein
MSDLVVLPEDVKKLRFNERIVQWRTYGPFSLFKEREPLSLGAPDDYVDLIS